MHRNKKHKIKHEKPETSSAFVKRQEDYDLTYYIHDRVELMHQVFSVLKHKDLKAIAPECVRHISIDDLQELCTEELLGISSKRLCAILDGAEPPSDTESSSASQSPERLETISLDSISSDEEILSQASSKKSKKHKHRRGSKSKKHKKKEEEPSTEASRASRAGLTVLELLELQARARAIRAQLQQEQAAKQASEPSSEHPASDNDDVEIKEEPADVVEISDDDDKVALAKSVAETSKTTEKQNANENATNSVTKVINSLTITVPQQKQSRKIKLKRSKASIVATTVATNGKENPVEIVKEKPVTISVPEVSKSEKPKEDDRTKEKQKRKKKKDKKKEGSDDDEITLQLSDTEKMDLLEDLDRKNYEKLSSSEDSESSSETSDSEDEKAKKETKITKSTPKTKDKAGKSPEVVKTSVPEDKTNVEDEINKSITQKKLLQEDTEETPKINPIQDNVTKQDNITTSNSDVNVSNSPENIENNSANEKERLTKKDEEDLTLKETEVCDEETNTQAKISENVGEKNVSQEKHFQVVEKTISESNDNLLDEARKETVIEEEKVTENVIEVTSVSEIPLATETDNKIDNTDVIQKDDGKVETVPSETADSKSDGELSERASSEVEAFELKPEVVCISDEEDSKKRKKKKKEKKSKKEKKNKKSKSDFREGGDQNFYKEGETEISSPISIEDDINEILELSDDSSCYEVGGILSKEPTAAEIEALSAKIDEIDRDDIITDEEIREHERMEKEKSLDIEVSWKDRYVESKKVKRVMSTSNIFNLLRKKNRELKKKLEESKIETEEEKVNEVPVQTENIEEGTIEHFNTLQGSKKYVDPVAEAEKTTEDKPTVSKAMKKDAKQLLKMYKKLLMYNDMSRGSDPNRKKKKSKKKRKNSGDANTAVTVTPA